MKLSDITKEVIISGFQEAIKKLIKNDKELLDKGASERSLQFRLACYLREFFEELESEKIYIDTEYNRYEKESKMDRANKKFYPDIILHERGSVNHNLVYCEIKKAGDPKNRDANKIIEQMENIKYNYINGINLYKLQSNSIKLDMYVKHENVILEPESYYYNFETEKLELENKK